MSLRHGARQLMDLWEADEDEAMRLLNLAVERLKYNPDFAIDQIHKAQARILSIRERRTMELPEHIQKAAPPVERRMDDLEAQIAELRALFDHPNVTRFRKAE